MNKQTLRFALKKIAVLIVPFLIAGIVIVTSGADCRDAGDGFYICR